MNRADDSKSPEEPALEELLAQNLNVLIGFLRNRAGGLARFESAEDLAQGVHLHALQVADRFEYRGEEAFRAWMFAVARQHVADRNAHWKALKRNAGPMLRVTFGGGGTTAGPRGFEPPQLITGPSTFASRREQVEIAMRALDSLPERDAHLVRMVSADASIAEMAEALGLSYEATQRARLRAIERFRKVFELARRSAGRDP